MLVQDIEGGYEVNSTSELEAVLQRRGTNCIGSA
jgi:hypothetical protein